MALSTRFACLTYHAIANAGSQYIVTEEQFRRQLEFLRQERYLVEDFTGLEARLRSNGPFPQRYVVVTFDDGDKSSLRAAEMLAEFGFPASFFVTRDNSMRSRRFLSPADICQIRRMGFSLGTHGASHRRLSLLPEDECLAELKESKQWLEDLTGEPVKYMSPPYGFSNGHVLELARQQGYILIGTSDESLNWTDKIKLPGVVSRVAIRRHFSHLSFRHIVRGFAPFYLWRQVRTAALALPKALLFRSE